jgi:tetratricopeptide (TPR) repeat protein
MNPPPPQSSLTQIVEQALAFHRQGRLDDAEKIYARVLKSYPDHFDALHLLGMLRHQRGKNGEAHRLITAALRVEPRSADALSNLALVLHALKRHDEALAALDKALELEPAHTDALVNSGNTLLDRGRPQEALTCFEKVLAREPGFSPARLGHGNTLATLGRPEEALVDYDAVLVAQPAHASAHYNRGNALLALGRASEALAAFDKTLAIVPNHTMAMNNRGAALQALNRYEEAIASFDQVLAMDKNYADAQYNRAQALLTIGDFRRGLEAYEWRWKRTGMAAHRPAFGRPLWLGEYPLSRKTILLHAEQGLGDTIQFARYLPLVAKTAGKVVLQVQPELKDLLAQIDVAAMVVGRDEALPAFDVHCPLGSLPLAFKTEIGTIPADIPYLKASEERLNKWRARVPKTGQPLVAIAWAGRATHGNDRNRSLAVSRLAPLLSQETARFVSIQRDLREGDSDFLRTCPGLEHVGDELEDFADTAAVVALADLVISVDTSVAHLAGAMGQPVWILLPFAPDWRWLLDRDDSPWYPTAKLFRQPVLGDWDSVIERVRRELALGPAQSFTWQRARHLKVP